MDHTSRKGKLIMVRDALRKLAYFCFFAVACCQYSKAESLRFDFHVLSYQGDKFHNLVMNRNILSAVQIAIDALKAQQGPSFDFDTVGFSVEADFVLVSVAKLDQPTNTGKIQIIPTGGGFVVTLSKTDLKVVSIEKGA